MIEIIRGTLLEKQPTRAVVDLNGLGLEALIPFSSYKVLGEAGGVVTLLTHLHWREDGPQLFGFATEAERTFFRMLNKVNKIGPKLALHIMSVADMDQVVEMILTENIRGLTALKGVGEKLASRLVVELRETLAKSGLGGTPRGAAEARPVARAGLACEKEARAALETLGYTSREIDRALAAVAGELAADAPLAAVVEAALRQFSS
ncbi:MAG: Holliday junction branch migration protein RuvA [Candidatus Riflebacteria bacterium]|nr:Holliday junction branch migration protein RuvA [Candidatus Riflebacteria bacterium]